MPQPIRILITDDHAIVREGLRALIGVKPDMELAGEAADGEEAVVKARSLRPDVILMDLVMPRKSGIEAIGEIKRENPGARILVLTSFAEDDQVLSAIKAGALGYLLKDSSPQELVEAIRCVYRGESSLHPAVARKLILGFGHQRNAKPDVVALTEREMEVLKLVARGLSNQAVAEQLHIGEGTVRFHVSNILSKLQLENRTQAVLYALREGLVTLED
jgi:NarL family two-component system response regulator LiaR